MRPLPDRSCTLRGVCDLQVRADEDVVRNTGADFMDSVRAVAHSRDTVDGPSQVLGNRRGLAPVRCRVRDDRSRPGTPALRDPDPARGAWAGCAAGAALAVPDVALLELVQLPIA